MDDGKAHCKVWRENDRYIIRDCNGDLEGEVKDQKRKITNGTFAVRKGSGKKDTKKLLKYIGGMDEYVDKGDTVYIKTSFSFVSDSPNDDILNRVVKEARKSGAKEVAIIDNDTPYRTFSNDLIVKSGYYDTVKDKEIPIYNVNKSERVHFQTDQNSFYLPKILFEDDVKLINIAPMRHDLNSGVNLGQKNLIDLVSPDDIYRNREEDLVVSVNRVLRPDITILDGSRSCLSGYPLSCRRDDGNFVLMSDDPVCADAWGSKILFYPVDEVEHIIKGDEMGVGKMNCMEAKKSSSPITVAKGKWKQLAPSPKMVKMFSEAKEEMIDSLGGRKTTKLWTDTVIPIIDKIKRE